MSIFSEIQFTGYSMYPLLKPGDKLLIRETDFSSLHIGDIVLFRYTDRLVAHRLVNILPGLKGIFKGDSLPNVDSIPIGTKDIVGRLDAVIRKDRFISFRTGIRFRTRRLFAFLSLHGLMPGILRLRIKNLLISMFQSKQRAPSSGLDTLVNILKGQHIEPDQSIEWSSIVETAEREGLSGVLYHALKELQPPPPILSGLKESFLRIAAHNLMVVSFLERLENFLSEEKIEVMTLKGASLLNNVYPWVERRPMGDIDLMVRPRDRKRFVLLLANLGFKRHPFLSHIYRKNRVFIDLHIHALNTDRIASRAGLFPSGMGPIWANSIPWREGYQWLRRPDDEDNLLLLSQHLLKHSFSRLIWLVDIYELLKDRDLSFWTRLSKRADQLFQRKPLSYVLYLLKEILELNPPQNSEFKHLSEELSRIEREILSTLIIDHPVDHMGNLLSLLNLPGYKQRLGFLLEILFPDKRVVQQEFSAASGKRMVLYYPLRLFRAFILVLRHFFLILKPL